MCCAQLLSILLPWCCHSLQLLPLPAGLLSLSPPARSHSLKPLPGYSKFKIEAVPCFSRLATNKSVSHPSGLNSLSGLEKACILLNSCHLLCSTIGPRVAWFLLLQSTDHPFSHLYHQPETDLLTAGSSFYFNLLGLDWRWSPALLPVGGPDLTGSQNGCSFLLRKQFPETGCSKAVEPLAGCHKVLIHLITVWHPGLQSGPISNLLSTISVHSVLQNTWENKIILKGCQGQ